MPLRHNQPKMVRFVVNSTLHFTGWLHLTWALLCGRRRLVWFLLQLQTSNTDVKRNSLSVSFSNTHLAAVLLNKNKSWAPPKQSFSARSYSSDRGSWRIELWDFNPRPFGQSQLLPLLNSFQCFYSFCSMPGNQESLKARFPWYSFCSCSLVKFIELFQS